MTLTEQSTETVEPVEPADESTHESTDESAGLVEDDVLVEEISIDGMCGVY